MALSADLHIHTYFSDSTSSPQEVVDDALAAGLSCIAITDHDIVEGVNPAIEAARPHALEVVPGIELSSELENCDIHILGYFIDHQKGPLLERIDIFLDARMERMKKMIMNLKSVGVDNIEFEEVCALTKSRAVGRAHLAMLLQQKGWVSNIKSAFEKYLGPGCPGYASKYKQTPFEAIELIRSCGGVAVMAHPMLTQKDELIPRFVAAGLKGLEVYYPNCMTTVTEFYERIAQKNGLIATGGSDAHGKAKSYTYVGKKTVPLDVVEQLAGLKMNNDFIYMNRAWELALKGWGRTSPNPMVGAVLVKSGKIIAEGYHHYCGGDHAEIDAFKKAGSKAKGAVLYVTLEPCGHWGRTAPCTQAILKSGIKKVIVGALDPNGLNNGKSLKFLRQQGIEVEQGLLADELTHLNEAFNCWIATGRPFVTAKIAQTLDGKIAASDGGSKWITSAFARDYAHRLRFGFDAIMVGINTVLKDDPQLRTLPAKRIKKIILDTHGKMPPRAKLLENTRAQEVFVFTARPNGKKIKAQVIKAPLYRGKIDLKWVLSFLGESEMTSVLIESGGAVTGEALQRNLVNKMMIYAAPKIMGEGIQAVRGLRSKTLDEVVQLKEMTFDKIGEDILIQGYPNVHRQSLNT